MSSHTYEKKKDEPEEVDDVFINPEVIHSESSMTYNSSVPLETPIVSDDVDDDEQSEREDNSDNEEDPVESRKADADVTISMDENSKLVARSSVVCDYQLRGDFLHDLNLWEYTARVTKVRTVSSKKKSTLDAVEESDGAEDVFDDNSDDEDDESPPENFNSDHLFSSIEGSKWSSLHDALTDSHRLRPKVQFTNTHPDVATFHQVLSAPLACNIPVPSGASIPRQDQPNIYARYCRLMLLLFKLWSHANDLQADGQLWVDAFDVFQKSCSAQILKTMNNMQILHECRDSRDDHFAERRAHNHEVPRGHYRNQHDSDDFNDEENTQEAILEHMRSLECVASD
ncbi:hypothetical protein EDD85DRAFT_956905 [Armillaria nabsnona]|nr:hypothetical protein EDD85DRAFT_956905 [Armillaria nabsnona]